MSDASGVPESFDAERAIVAAICADPELTSVSGVIIKSDDFYWSGFRLVYEAVLSLVSAGSPATQVEVYENLKRRNLINGVGGSDVKGIGMEMLADLYLVDPIIESHLESHCQMVSDYSALRRTIDVCRVGIVEATSSDKPARQIIDEVEAMMLSVQGDGRSNKTSARARDMVGATLDRISSYDGTKTTGIATGFTQFDDMTSGLVGGTLMIVAGRPSMGKTAFALNIAMEVGMQSAGVGDVALFSLEMDSDSLMDRLLASESRVSPLKWKKGRLSQEESARLAIGATSIGASTLWIDDSPSQTVLDIRAKCRRLAASSDGLKMIVIDYLQLLSSSSPTNRSREQEVAQMSLSLKSLARELSVPVICLSQLSRGPESRPNKRPMLSDLRESGAIEQDADIVAFLYRPEYYFPDDTSLHGVAELLVAKHRNGPTGSVPLVWRKEYMRFESHDNKKEDRFAY